MITARKIIKIPDFYMMFTQNARFLHDNCPKKIFSRILGRARAPLHDPRLLRLCVHCDVSKWCI